MVAVVSVNLRTYAVSVIGIFLVIGIGVATFVIGIVAIVVVMVPRNERICRERGNLHAA